MIQLLDNLESNHPQDMYEMEYSVSSKDKFYVTPSPTTAYPPSKSNTNNTNQEKKY